MGSFGGISPGGSIALGIIAGLVSTSVQSLGLTLQRKSHILEDEKGPYDVRRPPYRRRRWQIGMAMFVISNICGSSVQISILPLPVLSTLQASGLVFNSICATLILGEPFTRWSLWGTLLVCTGAVLIAVFGAIPSPAHKLSELLQLLAGRPFIIWMSLQAVLVVGIAVATDVVTYASARLMQDPRFRRARGLAYGCISGILSAHSLLVAKSAVELVVRTVVDGENQFVHWQSWMLVVGLVTLALTQLYYLHRGLKLISTSVLYPLVFCVYNIIAILDGLIYFDQTDLISPLRACLIALGTAILLAGVLSLSWRLSDAQHAPVAAQSTLAPGLGLADDTEGEEEEEVLLLGPHPDPDDGASTYGTYQTFGQVLHKDDASRPSVVTTLSTPQLQQPKQQQKQRKGAPSPILRHSQTMGPSRWVERAEIWGELEDRDAPTTPTGPLNSPRSFHARRRSTTLPIRGPNSPGLPHPSRRVLGGSLETRAYSDPRLYRTSYDNNNPSPGPAAGEHAPLLRRPDNYFATRRRRKSTGFAGLAAAARRVSWRPISPSPGGSGGGGGRGGLQEAATGMFGLKWLYHRSKLAVRGGLAGLGSPRAVAGGAGSREEAGEVEGPSTPLEESGRGGGGHDDLERGFFAGVNEGDATQEHHHHRPRHQGTRSQKPPVPPLGPGSGGKGSGPPNNGSPV